MEQLTYELDSFENKLGKAFNWKKLVDLKKHNLFGIILSHQIGCGNFFWRLGIRTRDLWIRRKEGVQKGWDWEGASSHPLASRA